MQNFSTSIVPLGFGYEEPTKSIIKTIGNGILFTYDDHIWVLTCRHIIEPFWGDHPVKAVFKHEGTQYFLMLNDREHLQFHLGDTDQQTIDLALYSFARKENFKGGDETLNLDALDQLPDLKEGDDLEVLAISSADMNPESVVSSKPIPLKTVKGSFIDYTFNLKPQDYALQFTEQHIMHVQTGGDMELSGGLVLAHKNGDYWPMGIITGSGNVKLMDSETGKAKNADIITFTHFKYLLQMLEPAEQFKDEK